MKTRFLLVVLAGLLLQSAHAQTNPPPITVVDVMMVYTQDALFGIGGEERMNRFLDDQITEFNRICQNSQVNARLNLVYRGVTSYTESVGTMAELGRHNDNSWEDYYHLMHPSDGELDDVQKLRNLYKADLLYLITQYGNDTYATTFTDTSADPAFQKYVEGCATYGLWLAGNRINILQLFASQFGMRVYSSGRYPYSRGYQFVADGISYCTVEEFGRLTIPYFSNPNVLYHGVPIGQTNVADDAKTMNLTAPLVANYRVVTNRFSFDTARYEVVENAGLATVKVVRTGDTNTTASVDVCIASGTAQAGIDFVAQTNLLTFGPGVLMQTCPITILDNATFCGNRTVKLTLQAPASDRSYAEFKGNALGLQSSAELAIQDDESGFVFTQTNYVVPVLSCPEVRRVGDTNRAGSVAFATRDGTARDEVDYKSASGILEFQAGETAKQIQITLLGAPAPSSDRSFTVNLSDPSLGTSVGTPASAAVRIVNQPQPGSVDEGFPHLVVLSDTDTSWIPRPNSGAVTWSGLAVRPNGKVLIGGHFSGYAGVIWTRRYGLAQFNPSGPFFDLDFNPPRISIGPAPEDGGVYAGAGAIAWQSDGKVILSNFGLRGLTRLNEDGSIDTSFKENFIDGTPATMMVQPDDKIVIVGWFNKAGEMAYRGLARFNPDGSLDTGFTNGMKTAIPAGDITICIGADLQPDGKILVGGLLVPNVSPFPHIGFCVRLNPDGTRDTNFTRLMVDGEVLGVKVLPDGRILAGGYFVTNVLTAGFLRTPITHPKLVRLLPDGALDETFHPALPVLGRIQAIVLQPDGRIILAGRFFKAPGEPCYRLIRLNDDGSVDPSFDPGLGPNDEITAMAAHAAGWLYIGGSFDMVNGLPKTFLARLRLDGTNPKLANPEWNGDQLHLTLQGLPGIYALESSADLKMWKPLATVTNWGDKFEWKDPDATGQATRFYRAVVK